MVKLEIRPFGALRYNESKAGEVKTLCCPPYDIIRPAEHAAYLEQTPYNVVRLELPLGTDAYAQAGRTLDDWLHAGILCQDAQPGIYVYEEEFCLHGQTRRVRGFIARVRLEEFSKGVILPHEETLSKAKEDRFQLLCATGCNVSQIYSLYMDEDRTAARLVEQMSADEPLWAFTDSERVTHRLWLCQDKELCARLAAVMSDKRGYIADGHHRYETALHYRDHLQDAGRLHSAEDPANFVMMMLVNLEHEGLTVFPTHRVLGNLAGFDAQRLLDSCAQDFLVEQGNGDPQESLDQAYAQEKTTFVLYQGGGVWHRLTLRDPAAMQTRLPDASDAYRGLDVSVLHTLVLERLGIDQANMAGQKNLRYTRDQAEACALVDRGEADCAFLLNPTRVEQIAAVAAAGEKMPQKSTYFYPKLITGLVINQVYEQA